MTHTSQPKPRPRCRGFFLVAVVGGAGSSGALLLPSPPAEKTTARQDQAGKASASEQQSWQTAAAPSATGPGTCTAHNRRLGISELPVVSSVHRRRSQYIAGAVILKLVRGQRGTGGVSGVCLPPSPPAEKTTARQDQARQSSASNRTGSVRNQIGAPVNGVIGVMLVWVLKDVVRLVYCTAQS